MSAALWCACGRSICRSPPEQSSRLVFARSRSSTSRPTRRLRARPIDSLLLLLCSPPLSLFVTLPHASVNPSTRFGPILSLSLSHARRRATAAMLRGTARSQYTDTYARTRAHTEAFTHGLFTGSAYHFFPFSSATAPTRDARAQWRSSGERCRGAVLIMSSMRRIISAASCAEISTCSLHLYDSVMRSCSMSATTPLNMSRPAVRWPW